MSADTDSKLDRFEQLRQQAMVAENCRLEWEKSKAETKAAKEAYDEAMDALRIMGITDHRQNRLEFDNE